MIEDWKDKFAPHIITRGKKYFEDGNVRRIQHCGNTYIAVVVGTEDYEVEITIGEGNIEEMLCSCPYAYENNCKHMAAVLLALESKSISIEEIPTVKQPTIVSHIPVEIPWLEAIDNLPENIIRKELLKRADRDARLKERLSVIYLGKLPEGQLQNWKADLQEIAGEYIDRRGRINDEDTWCFFNDLSNFLDSKLPLLFEVGAMMDTFHLIWIVMETALEWEVDNYYEGLHDLLSDCKAALNKLWSMASKEQQMEIMQWHQEHRCDEWPGGVDNVDRIFCALKYSDRSLIKMQTGTGDHSILTLDQATAIFQKLIDEQKAEYTIDQISLIMFDDPIYVMIALDKNGKQIFPGEVFPSIRYSDGSLIYWEDPCPV